MLAYLWIDSSPILQACPNLLRLNLTGCTSVTMLPDSIGCLNQLQMLDLVGCENLQQLPSSIGQLTTLEFLWLEGCTRLEALPSSIILLSKLRSLWIGACSSILKLPTSVGIMKNLKHLSVDIATELQAVGIGKLNALESLIVFWCSDEAVDVLDSLQEFRNLHLLSTFGFFNCLTMTKLPKSMGLLTNLVNFELYNCEKVQELPDSIGQLKLLKKLWLRECNSLETLPDSLGALTSLQVLVIVLCTSITELPATIGNLLSLCELEILSCNRLQSVPSSLKHLKELRWLGIMDCGTLEGLDLLEVLQGMRMWGCTSITKLPGSCLIVVNNYGNVTQYVDYVKEYWACLRNLEELEMVEANDCGFLRIVDDGRRSILQRVYKSPCCKFNSL